MYEIIQARERISKDAIKVWRISSVFTYILLIAISAGLLWASYFFDWPRWLSIIFLLATIFYPLLAIWAIFIRPSLLYRFWRYGIDEHYVRLKFGILTKSDIVVPMTKIQYVEANQGPIMRRYNLHSLTIGTLGSSHDIPALKEEEAFKLRDLISNHAKIKEVE